VDAGNTIVQIAIYGIAFAIAMVFFVAQLRLLQGVNQALIDWSIDNKVFIVKRSTIWFSVDPFVMFARKSHKIFRIEVRDRHGELRHAFARIRIQSSFLSLTAGACEVKWLD